MSFFQAHWERKREKIKALQQAGNVTITEVSSRLQVVCPESDTFTAGAKELGGRWRHKTGIWSFRLSSKRLVMILIKECFPEAQKTHQIGCLCEACSVQIEKERA